MMHKQICIIILKIKQFKIKLPIGVHENRFYLTFSNRNTAIANSVTNGKFDDVSLEEIIDVKYVDTEKVLHISNDDNNVTVSKVHLYNLVGQLVQTWEVANQKQTNIQIQMSAQSAGVYIVKVETSNGSLSEKISIK